MTFAEQRLVRPNGIAVSACRWSIIAQLGVVKAGGAVVFVDQNHPTRAWSLPSWTSILMSC